jgi:hypothetical protein
VLAYDAGVLGPLLWAAAIEEHAIDRLDDGRSSGELSH